MNVSWSSERGSAQILKIYAHARAAWRHRATRPSGGIISRRRNCWRRISTRTGCSSMWSTARSRPCLPLFWGRTPPTPSLRTVSGWTIPCPMARCTGWHRPASSKGVGKAVITGVWSTARACVRTPMPTTDHAASAGKERLYPLRRHPCGGRIAPLCLPEAGPDPAAGLKTEHTPKEPRSADAEPAMQDCARRSFLSLRPAPLTLTERTKPRTAKMHKYRSTENPHGHRPESKFVNEKCLKTLSFLCRLCYNNTRPCVRDRKLYAMRRTTGKRSVIYMKTLKGSCPLQRHQPDRSYPDRPGHRRGAGSGGPRCRLGG